MHMLRVFRKKEKAKRLHGKKNNDQDLGSMDPFLFPSVCPYSYL